MPYLRVAGFGLATGGLRIAASRLGLPQMHISGIETGKVAPRFDTMLDLVRVLDHDLLLVPRDLVPVVQSLTRDRRDIAEDEGPLYRPDEEEEPSS